MCRVETDMIYMIYRKVYKHNPVVLNSPGVLVSCEISNEPVVGSSFGYDNVTGDPYRIVLIDYLFLRKQLLREYFGFQKDGCSAHYFNVVKAYLNWKVPDRQIESRGQVL